MPPSCVLDILESVDEVGGVTSPGRGYELSMNHFSICPRALLQTATICAIVLCAHAADAGVPVVGLWRFNEGSGTNITDSSGFNNNGVLAGENGNMPAWVAGQAGFGSALRFTNDTLNHAYAEVPGSSSLQVGLT